MGQDPHDVVVLECGAVVVGQVHIDRVRETGIDVVGEDYELHESERVGGVDLECPVGCRLHRDLIAEALADPSAVLVELVLHADLVVDVMCRVEECGELLGSRIGGVESKLLVSMVLWVVGAAVIDRYIGGVQADLGEIGGGRDVNFEFPEERVVEVDFDKVTVSRREILEQRRDESLRGKGGFRLS
ncbi:hypothetical protein [Rhodococcus koreensis]